MATMQTQLKWNEKLSFNFDIRGHHGTLDAKKEVGGEDRGPNPKEMLLTAICGCSGMDVVSLLKKYKVDFTQCEVDAKGETTEGGYPVIFKRIDVTFRLTLKGENTGTELIQKAVDLSMTKYCGVSAMVSKASPIFYSIVVNEVPVHTGQANFG